MKRLFVILPLALSIMISCQDQQANSELEELKALAKLEDQNKAMVEKFFVGINNRNDHIFADLCTTDYKWYLPSANPNPLSREEELASMKLIWKGFSDIMWTIEEMIAQMTANDQKVFVDTIQLTQNAITSLLEKEFDATTKINNSILEKLEILLSSKEMPKSSESVLVTLVSITQEIFTTLEIGKGEDEQAFKVAAEKVSIIWLKNIGEKW